MQRRRPERPHRHSDERVLDLVIRAWLDVPSGRPAPAGHRLSAERVLLILRDVAAACAYRVEARAWELHGYGAPMATVHALLQLADELRAEFGLRRVLGGGHRD